MGMVHQPGDTVGGKHKSTLYCALGEARDCHMEQELIWVRIKFLSAVYSFVWCFEQNSDVGLLVKSVPSTHSQVCDLGTSVSSWIQIDQHEFLPGLVRSKAPVQMIKTIKNFHSCQLLFKGTMLNQPLNYQTHGIVYLVPGKQGLFSFCRESWKVIIEFLTWMV